MKKIEEKIEHLEQLDYIDDSYLEKVEDKYGLYIGVFLMRFSALEHSLNISIADYFGDDWHSRGYIVIERLTTSNKIDLYKKLYSEIISFQSKKGREGLNSVVNSLEALNKFRNSLVHANWSTIDKDGYVRTRIEIDNDVGQVNFKKIKIGVSVINKQINNITKAIELLENFSEKARGFYYEDKNNLKSPSS